VPHSCAEGASLLERTRAGDSRPGSFFLTPALVTMGMCPGLPRSRWPAPAGAARSLLGAPVSARAETGEVLVSRTVKDLVAGSGIGFDDRGLAELKGVPGNDSRTPHLPLAR